MNSRLRIRPCADLVSGNPPRSSTRQNQITDLMQIARNKDAQGAKLLGWFKQIGHHHGHHSSRRRRSYANMQNSSSARHNRGSTPSRSGSSFKEMDRAQVCHFS